MWGSNNSWNWNAVDVGPGRDLVGDLAASIRNRTDIHFGVYHSLFEWYNPLYLADQANGYQTQDFIVRKTMPELFDLVNTYEPEIIWSDGDWETTDTYWNSTGFLAWLYNDSPVRDTVVTNDRWGSNAECTHGGYYTCSDRYNPGVLVTHKWENAMTIDSASWGYRREATLDDYLTIEEILTQLVSTVSCNGNLLLNIGPTHEGTIIPIFEERLRQMGSWLAVNGEAIYESTYWTAQNDNVTSTVWYTMKTVDNAPVVYAIFLSWPSDNSLVLGSVVNASGATISLLGLNSTLHFETSATRTTVTLPTLTTSQMPCQWAWSLRIEGL
jgi:alpha-L-fucosidase